MLYKHKQTKTVVQSLKSGEICWKFKIFNNTAFKMSKRYRPMLGCAWIKPFVGAPKTFERTKSKNRATTWSDCNSMTMRFAISVRDLCAIYTRFSLQGGENKIGGDIHINFVDEMFIFTSHNEFLKTNCTFIRV